MRQAGADSNCIGIKFRVQQWGKVGGNVSQYTNKVKKSSPSNNYFIDAPKVPCLFPAIPVLSSHAEEGLLVQGGNCLDWLILLAMFCYWQRLQISLVEHSHGWEKHSGLNSVPVLVCSGMCGPWRVYYSSAVQNRHMYLPLAIRWQEERVTASTSLCPAEKKLPTFSMYSVQILFNPSYKSLPECSGAVTILPPLFFLSPLTQLYTPPNLSLHPGWFKLPGPPLALHSLTLWILFLLQHEACLIPVTCQLPLATLKSHPLTRWSALLTCPLMQ